MSRLCFTLCAEGSTDEMLLPVVQWALSRATGATVVEQLSTRTGPLERRIDVALDSFVECDLLLVHRDTETAEAFPLRVAEIDHALTAVRRRRKGVPPVVRVIPALESEAWLLFNEAAIRRAAGRANGKAPLRIPARPADQITDPKSVLRDALLHASEARGRERDRFRRTCRPVLVAREIDDFAPLRQLPAFAAFEAEVRAFADAWIAARGPSH